VAAEGDAEKLAAAVAAELATGPVLVAWPQPDEEQSLHKSKNAGGGKAVTT